MHMCVCVCMTKSSSGVPSAAYCRTVQSENIWSARRRSNRLSVSAVEFRALDLGFEVYVVARWYSGPSIFFCLVTGHSMLPVFCCASLRAPDASILRMFCLDASSRLRKYSLPLPKV